MAGPEMQCPECDTTFEVGTSVTAAAGDTVSFAGALLRAKCPNCGAQLERVARESYTIDASGSWRPLVSLLSVTGAVVEDYRQLAVALEGVGTLGATASDAAVAERLSEAAPKFGPLTEWLRGLPPEQRRAVIALLVPLLMFLVQQVEWFIQQAEQTDKSETTITINVNEQPPDDQVQRLINERLRELQQSPPPASSIGRPPPDQ